MGADAEAVVLCDAFTLWAQAARRAPVNLTRADWTQSLGSFGPYASAYPARAVYGPGKFNGGDSYAPIEWRKECSCWFQLGRHQPACLSEVSQQPRPAPGGRYPDSVDMPASGSRSAGADDASRLELTPPARLARCQPPV